MAYRKDLRTWIVAVLLGSCAPSFDTTRETKPRGSLGEELFGVVCDRVGAQSLREDVTGASYQALCHRDGNASFANRVDLGLLPALDRGATRAGQELPKDELVSDRAHNIARVETLAEHRDPLVLAFEAMIPGGLSKNAAGDDVALRDTLPSVLSALVPLYEDETVPRFTRALGGLSSMVVEQPEIATALTRLDARDGYHPEALALYVLRPLLSYPRLFDLGAALARVHRENTNGAREELSAVFRTLSTSIDDTLKEPVTTLAPLETRVDKAGLRLLSRPRSTREFSLALLGDDSSLARESLFSIVRRDARGVADVVSRAGVLPYPFVADASGKPTIDALGRFVTIDGTSAPLPFSTTSDPAVVRDVLGRALGNDGMPMYGTLDVTGTFVFELSGALAPLVNSRALGGQGLLFETRTLATALLGPKIARDGAMTFDAEKAPLVDLAHAFGATLERPEIDDVLVLFSKLARERPEIVARLSRLMLNLDKIADRHPEAVLKQGSTFWDELIDVFAEMSREPGLIEDLLKAFQEPRTEALGAVFASYMRYRDELTYARDTKNPERRESLNGPVENLTTSDFSDMRTPVDRTAADTGKNRSILQRFLALLHDANGLSACSKDNAVAHVDVKWPPGSNGLPVRLDYPTNPLAKTLCAFLGSRAPDKIAECGILRFDNIAELIVDVVLGDVQIDVRDDCLKKLMVSPLANVVGGADAFLEDISGIDGFSVHPTVKGVARLAFFDAPYDNWGGYAGDKYYSKTSKFLKDVLAPVPSMVCKPQAFVDPSDQKSMTLRRCDTFEDTLRGRHPNGLFPLEQLGFLEKVIPLAEAFGKHHATRLFVSLLDVLHRHWADARQTRAECDPTLPKTNARWCAQDGLVSYEPLLAEMLDEGELFQEIAVLTKLLGETRIAHCDERDASGACVRASERDGIAVMAEAVRGLVDPERNRGLVNKNGEQRARRNDGTFSPQATPLTLWLDALADLDAQESVGENKRAYLAARSSLIDALLQVEGSKDRPHFALEGLARAVPVALDLFREQVAAHCPARAGKCKWSREDLPASVRDLVSAPLTARLLSLFESLANDQAARSEIERFLAHLLTNTQDDATQASIVAALIDLIQVSEDADGIRPVLRLASRALQNEAGQAPNSALFPASIELLSRFFEARKGARESDIDPSGALALVLKNAVVPMNGQARAPLEVFIEAFRAVNRANPRDKAPYAPLDFAVMSRELSAFLLDRESGLEQVYKILSQASGR